MGALKTTKSTKILIHENFSPQKIVTAILESIANQGQSALGERMTHLNQLCICDRWGGWVAGH